MRWTYRIFKVNGISVELHLTFILFFLLILAFSGVQAFLFFSLIFTVVLAHELIHSFTAIIHGIRVPRITLTPIGGLASIELPDDPVLEIKVSVVGPLFNFMLAGIGVIMLYAVDSGYTGFGQVVQSVFSDDYGMGSLQSVLSVIVSMNFTLGAFNMLPAFPMDGGRVFRGVLALWMDYAKATRIASAVGQLMFACLTVLGILSGNIWWVFIGLFLYYAGGSELRYVNLRSIIGDARMRDLASSGISYVSASLTWREFMSTVYRKGRRLYLIVGPDGALRGVLDVGQVAGAAPDGLVGDSQTAEYGVLDGRLRAADALKQILSKRLVLVVEDGKFIGYVDPETLSESAAYLSLTGGMR
jgi:Zn-dependent protease